MSILTVKNIFLVFLGVGIVSPMIAQGGNACIPQGIDLYANYEAISVRIPYNGDDNENASTTVEFRQLGQAEWRLAQPLVRISAKRFAGSIFNLTPGASYEVRVQFSDPDGASPGQLSGSVSTRSEQRPTGSGTTKYVAVSGSDGWPGTQQQPYRTVQHAVDQAGPGDVIIVTAGVYRESIRITSSGQADAYILIQGQSGATISGAQESYDTVGSGLWVHVSGDLYYTPMATKPIYVAAAGLRLYYWPDLAGLQDGTETIGGTVYSVDGGWTYDSSANRLYVRLPDGGSPNDTTIQLTSISKGIEIDNAAYVILDGLDVGFFGNYCISIEDSAHCVVRNSLIHNARNGLRVNGYAAGENLIDNNELYDTAIWDWPWKMVKGHDPEGCAISITAGRGNVYRNNRCHGFFNAIVPSLWGQLYDESYNPDMDVHDNVIWETGDDGLEPEGACVNQRYWNNRAEDVLVGVSLAPITVGPCYFIRNTVYNHHLTAVKLDSNSSGPVLLYHNTLVTTVHNTDHYSYRENVNAIGVSGTYHNHTYRNNIIQGTDYAYCDWLETSPVGLDMDYDNLYTTHATHFVMIYQQRYANLAALQQGTQLEQHGMSEAAGFADLAGGDLTLTGTSPLIDQGVRLWNINDDYLGGGPDMGANEFPSGPAVYELSVTNGSGSGDYEEGQVVAVSADGPSSGKLFSRWIGDTSCIADTSAANTTVTMPAADVSITATYGWAYELTVNSGSGDGLYLFGTVVDIEADPAPSNYEFDQWTGDVTAVADIFSPATTVTIPSSAVEVTATYEPIAIPGDLDGDLFVGQSDLDIVLDGWGDSPPADPRADPSGDNFVGQADLDIVLDHWGEGA